MNADVEVNRVEMGRRKWVEGWVEGNGTLGAIKVSPVCCLVSLCVLVDNISKEQEEQLSALL